MKSLEIKITSFCEHFQKRFYFKNVRRELSSSWSVRKISNFLFDSIINMKFFDKLTLFICHLFRLYKKHVKKELEIK